MEAAQGLARVGGFGVNARCYSGLCVELGRVDHPALSDWDSALHVTRPSEIISNRGISNEQEERHG